MFVIRTCSRLSGQSAWIWSPSLPQLTLPLQPITERAQSQRVRVRVSAGMRGRSLSQSACNLCFYSSQSFCFIPLVQIFNTENRRVTMQLQKQTRSSSVHTRRSCHLHPARAGKPEDGSLPFLLPVVPRAHLSREGGPPGSELRAGGARGVPGATERDTQGRLRPHV